MAGRAPDAAWSVGWTFVVRAMTTNVCTVRGAPPPPMQSGAAAA